MRPHLSILIWMILLSMLVTPPLWAAEEDEEPAPFVTPELVVPEPASAVMGWVDSRELQSLNGSWKLLGGPHASRVRRAAFLEAGRRRGPRSTLFSCWNTVIQTLLIFVCPVILIPSGKSFFSIETRCGTNAIFKVEAEANTRYHLWFGGANFDATVFLNGTPVARHKGGYVPFSVEVTAHLQASRAMI